MVSFSTGSAPWLGDWFVDISATNVRGYFQAFNFKTMSEEFLCNGSCVTNFLTALYVSKET